MGMLMERHRVDATTAQELLDRVASELGIEGAVLAEAVIALLAPQSPSPPITAEAARPRADPTGIGGDDGTAGAPTADDTDEGCAAAQLIADLTGARPDGTVIYSVVDDSTLRRVGSTGTPDDAVGGWQSVPLAIEVPLCASATQRRPIFLESAIELERQFPAARGGSDGAQAWAVIPILEDGRATGVVGLSWRAAVTLDEATREGIVRSIQAAGRVMVRALPTATAGLGTLTGLLDLVPDPWVVLSATGSSGGGGFLVEAVAPSLPETWRATALGDLFPGLVPASELLSDLQHVLRSGAPLVRTITVSQPGGPPWDEMGAEIRIVRSGHRVVLTWR
jgi:hypothetical protein